MKRSKKVLISTAAVLILSTASISMVSARSHHGDRNYEDSYWRSSQMTEKRSEQMKQRMQDRLDFIKYKLQITAKQEPAWQELTKTLEDKFDSMVDRKNDRDTEITVTERVKVLRDHAEQMVQMADAIETLYKTLTPEQQKIADKLGPMGMRRF